MESIFILDELTEDGGAWFKVHVPNYKEVERYLTNGIATAWVAINDNRRLSPDQRRKWFALIGDIADYTGYPTEYLHIAFKFMYQMYFEHDGNISMSNVDMTTAKKMIDMVLNWCSENEIPLTHDTGQLFQSEEQWTYYCLKNRICVICGKKADLHHQTDLIGMGHNRKTKDDSNSLKLPLCRVHHGIAHNMGLKSFEEKYHVKPIIYEEV